MEEKVKDRIRDDISALINSEISFHDDLKTYETDYEYIGAEDFGTLKTRICTYIQERLEERTKQIIEEAMYNEDLIPYNDPGKFQQDLYKKYGIKPTV